MLNEQRALRLKLLYLQEQVDQIEIALSEAQTDDEYNRLEQVKEYHLKGLNHCRRRLAV